MSNASPSAPSATSTHSTQTAPPSPSTLTRRAYAPLQRAVARTTALLVAAGLLAAACSSAGITGDDTQARTSAETPAAEIAEPQAAATPEAQTEPQTEPQTDAEPAAAEATLVDPDDTDAASLMALAVEQSSGSVRGVVTLSETGSADLSVDFESTAAGDLAARLEVGPGEEPGFPDGAVAEIRYVGGSVYVRPPLTPEISAELGAAEVWHLAETGPDSLSEDLPVAGLTCVIPTVGAGASPAASCDPLGDVTRFLVAASEAEIVAREELRGDAVTKVRFKLPLLEIMDDSLGQPAGGDAPAPPPEDAALPGDGFAAEQSQDFPSEGFGGFFDMLDIGLEVDAWIDDFGLLRRLSYDTSAMFAAFGAPEGESAGPVLSAEFFDYDAAVAVSAPPAELLVAPGRIEDFYGN